MNSRSAICVARVGVLSLCLCSSGARRRWRRSSGGDRSAHSAPPGHGEIDGLARSPQTELRAKRCTHDSSGRRSSSANCVPLLRDAFTRRERLHFEKARCPGWPRWKRNLCMLPTSILVNTVLRQGSAGPEAFLSKNFERIASSTRARASEQSSEF